MPLSLRFKVWFAGLIPKAWWLFFCLRLFYGPDASEKLMILPLKEEKMDQQTERKSQSPTDLQLKLMVMRQNGYIRLHQKEQEAAAKRIQDAADRATLWAKYNDTLIAALPDVLQPYAERFSDPLMDPYRGETEKICVCLDEIDSAPLLVLLNNDLADSWKVNEYLVPGIECYTDETGRERVVWLWGNQDWEVEGKGENTIRTPDLEDALAWAFRRRADKERYQQRIEKAAMDAADQAEGKALTEWTWSKLEPEYLNVDDEGRILADTALSAAVRAVVRDEMYRPEPLP